MSMRTMVLVGAVLALAASTWSQGAEPAPAPVAGGAVVIYTKDNAPATPKLEDLPLKDSVSQYGITWTFDKPARVGQFVNGDWYVVGPVTVKAIDPAPIVGKDVPEAELDTREKTKVKEAERIRNGSMINTIPHRVSFDSGVPNYYDANLQALPPIVLKPGDSLLSSISLKQKEKPSFPYYASGMRQTGDNSPIKVLAILTCVAQPLPSDAFRPAYGDRTQTIYYARNFRRDLLPKLAPVKGTPDPVKFADIFQKPWFNTCFFGFEEPAENMTRYGQQVCQATSDAALLLCMDFKPEEKERLLQNYAQVGIDYWGLVKSGHPGWGAWGGHGSGRKLPIVFAGYLLRDEEMLNVGTNHVKTAFGEDEQTAYGDSWMGAKVVFTGHSGISASTDRPMRYEWGPYEHLTPDQWQKNGLNGRQSEAYRRANTSCAWVGEALVLRILKLEKAWNHDAFFDYVDRWMYEDDTQFLHTMNTGIGKPIVDEKTSFRTFAHQGYSAEGWVGEMWTKYRTAPGMPPTDGWKKQHDESYYRAAVERMNKDRPAPASGKAE